MPHDMLGLRVAHVSVDSSRVEVHKVFISPTKPEQEHEENDPGDLGDDFETQRRQRF